MSFDTIFDIMAGDRWTSSVPVLALQAASVQTDCHNYRLIGTNSCGSVASRTVYLDIPAFLPLTYQEVVKGYEDGEGIFVKRFQNKSPWVSFQLILNEDMLHWLHNIEGSVDVVFEDLENANTEDVRSMKIASTDLDGVMQVNIQLLIDQSSQIFRGCCGSLFDGTPYDDCDGTGEVPTDPACATFAVAISFSDPTLTATPSGGPSGTPTYTWFLDETGNGIYTEVGTGSGFNPVLPGVYKVIASLGAVSPCIAEDEYTYQGTCVGYEVSLTSIAGILIATANLITTSFEWFLEAVSQGTTTVPYFMISADGNWSVEGTTAAACTDLSNVVAVVQNDCTWTAPAITETPPGSGILGVLHGTGDGSPSYTWWYDDGQGGGLVQIAGEFAALYDTGGAQGYYQCRVTLDGCTKSAGFTFIDALTDGCNQWTAYIEQLTSIDPTTVRLHAASINPPDSVDYFWYERITSAWQLISSGVTVDITAQKSIKLIAQSGTCDDIEQELHFAVDPTNQTPYEEFIGTGAEVEFVVSAFTVPDTGALTVNEIMASHQVERNGIPLYYKPLVDVQSGGASENDRTAYSWDFAANKVAGPNGWPFSTGERLTTRKLY